MTDMRDLHEALENLPKRAEIEKRAYQLYLRDGEEFSPTEYWLKAEEELRQEQAKGHDPMPSKRNTMIAGAARRQK